MLRGVRSGPGTDCRFESRPLAKQQAAGSKPDRPTAGLPSWRVNDWPWIVTVVDLAWGSVLATAVSYLDFLAGKWLQ